MENCIFCKIVNKEQGADIVYEDENILAFKDVNPKAPVHILVIPKKHISSAKGIKEQHKELIGNIFYVIYNKLAKNYELESGFRVINNFGEDGGQTVDHLHFHLLGKRKFDENF